MSKASSQLRIAMVAPPWITVPPGAYGGTEAAVSVLTEELVHRGHDVELFCAPGSKSAATVRPLLDKAYPTSIGRTQIEADYVARVMEEIDAARPRFDVVHDHSGFTLLAMADRLEAPVVHTTHFELAPDVAGFYHRNAHKGHLVVLSQAQLACAAGRCRRATPEDRGGPELQATVIPHGLILDDWPFRSEKDDYLLWIGRMEEAKGPHRAIAVAREVGMRLILAGPVHRGQRRFFESQVLPHIDGQQIVYVGEVDSKAKKVLYAGAVAVLMPHDWCEAFGLVAIEALVTGTQVIGYPAGAIAEIVQPGRNGILVDGEAEMAAAVRSRSLIDPRSCRTSVAERYSMPFVVGEHERLYRRVVSS